MLSLYFGNLKKYLSIVQKIVLVIAVFAIVIGIFINSFNKNSPKTTYDTIKKQNGEIYRIIKDPTLNKSKEGKIKILVYRAMMCGLVGETCTDNPDDDNNNFNRSILGAVSNLITLPYKNPPASGVLWAYNGMANAGIVPQVHAAQGIGFASINAFSTMWKAFRDLAYLVLVMVIIAIGFMVMFRMKLNPQTVISVESALPRIVVTLILITFSFAIVGFMIDLMYVVTFIVVELAGKSLGIVNTSAAQSNAVGSKWYEQIVTVNIFGALDWSSAFLTYEKGFYALIDILPVTMRLILHSVLGLALFIIFVRLWEPLVNIVKAIFGDIQITGSLFTVVGGVFNLGATAGAIITFFVALLLSGFALWLIIAFLIVLGLVFLMFRILFTLLSSLVQIILYLILAPLLLMLEAVPGQSVFSSWFRIILGNLAVFPAVYFLLMLTSGISILYGGSKFGFLQWFFSSNINAQPDVLTPPLLAGIDSNLIAPLINAVLLLSIPDLVKALKQWIVGKGFQLPVGPGALFGSVGAVGGSVMGLMNQLYYFQMGSHALWGPKDKDSGKRTGILGTITETLGSALGRKP